MLYGLLAGKEFTATVHKNLERKISLECDGKLVILPPRLQGLVFLNIPSYMAGTNFWGTDKEKKVREREEGGGRREEGGERGEGGGGGGSLGCG